MRSRYSHDVTDTAVDVLGGADVAAIHFLTTGEHDLTVMLARSALVALHDQISFALGISMRPAGQA